ncbi:Ribosomal RNA large subunit methyltransferase I [Bremerella volcania]|uniref:Ribosomal RNA large subunit methyltransferase I n=1 Tax=Bremerella volcania TaxID=2527984 RepID=A0A518C500_9BACT|nr:class I SAM-dependent rRNA methyltransferase [Bremerella volcania]QDU74301.1 Ribosomal RNA large subunit methyltransferase I [Bremerella volcania]
MSDETSDASASSIPIVKLRPRKAQPFFGRHPWVRDSGIDKVIGKVQDGDVVQLHSDKDRFIAYGLINRNSHLRVRLYSWDQEQPLADEFWRGRLERAILMRREMGLLQDDTGCRLVYSEADGLSGLIVENFAGHLMIQVTSLGMYRRIESIAAILTDLLQPKSISLRGEAGILKLEGLEVESRMLVGELPGEPIEIVENDLRYEVDLSEGQKTGFYLDQRDNRRVAASYLPHNAKVLDMFCYSGGFAMNAARHGGAASVHGVDGSGPAVSAAQRNVERNQLNNVSFEKADCFDYLKARVDAGDKYDAIILDPPKFTKSRRTIDEALRAYFHINRHATQLLRPGGILVTCSCSGNVSRDEFLMMLLGVSQKTGRDLRLLEQRGAAPDHPVSATCLENEYLKCFIASVS